MLAAIPFRAWVTLLVAGAMAASVPLGLARWAAEPPYRALPARVHVELPETLRVLDRSGIRWRLEDRGQVLAVEHARFADAVELIAPQRSPRRAVADEDRRLSRELTELLVTTLGPENGHVSADVTVDGDRRRTASLRYGRRAVRLVDTRTSERATWEGPWQRGRWSRRSGTAVNSADAVLRRTNHAPGRRLTISVAIVLDRSVAPADARAFRSAVAAAIGVGAGRRVTLSRVELAPEVRSRARPAGPALIPADLGRWLPWSILVLGTATFLVQVRAALRPRDGDDAEPPWLSDAPRTNRQ